MSLYSKYLLMVIAALFLVPTGTRAHLIAHYRFNDGEPSDETGDFDGTAEGDATSAGPLSGVDGTSEAFQFSGGGHVVIPIDINPAVLPQLTVTMWVKADENIPQSPALYKTFGHDDGGWDRTFGLDHRGGDFRWAAFTGGDPPGPTQETGTPVTSEWTFLAAVWNSEAVGGPMVRFHAGENHIVEPLTDTFSGHISAAIGNLRPDNFSEGWRGLIDEVQIFDEALEIHDIQNIRNEISDPCSLGANYRDGMLTMNFKLGMPEPATWSVAIFSGEFVFPLWAIPLPAIDPPISFPISFPFPEGFGPIILVTTLSTAEKGITCFGFAIVDTGTL